MIQKSALSVRLPPRLKLWLKDRAETNGRSMNNEVIFILRCIEAAEVGVDLNKPDDEEMEAA